MEYIKKNLSPLWNKYKWIASALWEFFLNVFFASLPMLFGILTLIIGSKHNLSLSAAIIEISSKGELVIFSATLMAPILYAVQKDPPPRLKGLLQLIAITSLFSGIFIYSLGFYDSFTSSIRELSFICLSGALINFLILNMLNHKAEHGKSAPQIYENSQAKILSEYGTRRGIEQ